MVAFAPRAQEALGMGTLANVLSPSQPGKARTSARGPSVRTRPRRERVREGEPAHPDTRQRGEVRVHRDVHREARVLQAEIDLRAVEHEPPGALRVVRARTPRRSKRT
jgi:hypothetical protein